MRYYPTIRYLLFAARLSQREEHIELFYLNQILISSMSNVSLDLGICFDNHNRTQKHENLLFDELPILNIMINYGLRI